MIKKKKIVCPEFFFSLWLCSPCWPYICNPLASNLQTAGILTLFSLYLRPEKLYRRRKNYNLERSWWWLKQGRPPSRQRRQSQECWKGEMPGRPACAGQKTGSPGHRLAIVGRAQNQVVLILFSCPKQTRKPVEQLGGGSGWEDGWEWPRTGEDGMRVLVPFLRAKHLTL